MLLWPVVCLRVLVVGGRWANSGLGRVIMVAGIDRLGWLAGPSPLPSAAPLQGLAGRGVPFLPIPGMFQQVPAARTPIAGRSFGAHWCSSGRDPCLVYKAAKLYLQHVGPLARYGGRPRALFTSIQAGRFKWENLTSIDLESEA